MDSDYWKNFYQGSWKAASEKEDFIKNQISKETGLEITGYGLGTGSVEYIKGSAAENKKNKGDADFFIKKKNAFVEVTGPNVPVDKNADLWFRPDKIENAYNKFKADGSAMTFFVHLQKDKGTNNQQIRVLVVDESFFKKWMAKKYELIYPYFGGKQETYYSIPEEDGSIISFAAFINYLKK